jgi:predicted O-methyltransferase YrrM
MTEHTWTAVDQYITDLFVPADAALDAALASSAAAGLPQINVAPNQGKFLHLLARMHGAKKILEVGTLGGYSTIWLARALATGGSLITLEIDARHADVARKNIERAGLAPVVDIRVGPAIDTLPRIAAAGEGPFDFVFIDADKPSNADYFAWALKLSRVGTVIVIDNVIRKGAVADDHSEDPMVLGTRRLNAVMAADPRVQVTEVQTVGSKGYDGFALALVVAP